MYILRATDTDYGLFTEWVYNDLAFAKAAAWELAVDYGKSNITLYRQSDGMIIDYSDGAPNAG